MTIECKTPLPLPLPPLAGQLCRPEQSTGGTAVALRGGELIAGQLGEAEGEAAAAAASAEGQNSPESLKRQKDGECHGDNDLQLLETNQ